MRAAFTSSLQVEKKMSHSFYRSFSWWHAAFHPMNGVGPTLDYGDI